jgi:hypothetical protein
MEFLQFRPQPKLRDTERQPRHVGAGAVLLVAVVACAVLWALVLRFLMQLWI